MPAVGARPVLLTVTDTVALTEPSHTDISLWFVLECLDPDALQPDPREYRSMRWWSPQDIRAADPARFDPHMVRLLGLLEPYLT